MVMMSRSHGNEKLEPRVTYGNARFGCSDFEAGVLGACLTEDGLFSSRYLFKNQFPQRRRKSAKDSERHQKTDETFLASFVNERWAMKDDKKRRKSNETQRCYYKPSALLLQLTVAKY